MNKQEDEINKYSNYPPLGSGIKYYKGLDKYIDNEGFKFNIEDEITINQFCEIIGEELIYIGEAGFCDRNNIPLTYKKDGCVKKSKKIIDNVDYEDDIVIYKGVSPLWTDDETEWLYIITIDSHIIKIGMTITSVACRFGSYSCGDRKAMKIGSCSTTNFIINEVCYTGLLLNKKIDIYGIKIEKETKNITRFGKTSTIQLSTARSIETMAINVFKEHNNNKLPILCQQNGK
jgi:hypothetical protein